MADSPTPAPTAVTGGHLSIGEVLALLLEEFPDVTISKIRFLESQGLIDPERTASGYRKFYGDDVELLRCILREQRENYLPLRVIKDRIDSGEIDPTGEQPRPRGIKNVSDASEIPHPESHPSAGTHTSGRDDAGVTGAAVLFQRTDAPTTNNASRSDTPTTPSVPPAGNTSDRQPASAGPVTAQGAVLPGVLLTAQELCAMAGLSRDELEELQTYGVVTSSSSRSDGPFDEDAVEIATISKRFLDAGIEPRHLRGWRVAADREAGLLEQLIQPLLRQRNPQARAEAVGQLADLEETGGRLRAAMMRSSLRKHDAS